jgi:OmpA-OmpF porin, OOP family
MTRKFNFLCTLSLLIMFISTLAVAQPNANPTSEQGVMQQTEVTKGKYPERPIDMWEVGINAGNAFVIGDVFPTVPGGFGAGFHVRRALGYTFSVRGGYTFHQMTGKNFWTTGPAIGTNSTIANLGYTRFANNYKTTLHELSLEALVNLNNLKFHKTATKWGFYAGAGINYHFYDVNYDAKRADGSLHDFTALETAIITRGDLDRADLDLVKAELDGEYETPQSTDLLFEAENAPGYSITTGISYKINPKINISLDNRLVFSIRDNLDGYKDRASDGNDEYMYNSVRLNFNIGDSKKKAEPLYWLNPLDAPYDMIANNTQRLDNLGNLLADTDGDGVPDKLDKEANTPAGANVNTRGETLDSDGDGVADYLDKQPYTGPGLKVDGNGVHTPTDPGYVTKAEVEKMATSQKWVNETVTPASVSSGSSNWFLPMIHFDNGASTIKPTYYAQLHHVATVMQKNPGITVIIEGHASSTSSVQNNLNLSKKRAENAAKFLTENYGISSSRLVVKYEGETNPLNGSRGDSYMNRRVEFKVQ